MFNQTTPTLHSLRSSFIDAITVQDTCIFLARIVVERMEWREPSDVEDVSVVVVDVCVD